MGNYRFKLSDMIPNSWFYKLRDMKKSSSRKQKSPTTTTPPPPHHRHYQSNKKTQQPSTTTSNSSKPKQQFNNTTTPRKSYYFTRQHISSHTTSPQQQPRKSLSSSSKQRPTIKNSRRTTTPKPSSSSSSKFLVINVTPTINTITTTSDGEEPEFRTDRVLHTDSNSNSSSLDDIIIDVDNNSISITKSDLNKNNEHLLLPPILTKPKNQEKQQESRNKNKNTTTPCSRRFSVSSAAGARRLRINSPRVSGASFRKLHHQANASRCQRSTTSSAVTDASPGRGRSVSGSFAIVKSSLNPQRDFRESMVEMIVQNNIRSSKDLEDLLACYLTLNSDEYHGLIINVFKQVWFDLTDNNNNNYMYQRQE